MPPALPEDPRQIWVTDDPPEDSARAHKHRLVRHTKRAIENLALVDLSDGSPKLIEKLVALEEQIGDIADELGGLPSLRAKGGPAAAGGDDAALLERSGISGRSNPIAAPLHMWVEGEVTRGRALFTAVYEGPPGCLHGGFVAAAFDDLLGYAQIASGMAGYTGTLTVRMVRPTPLYQVIEYAASLDRVEGRKIYVTGRSWCGEDLLAECEIVFIRPRAGDPVTDQIRKRAAGQVPAGGVPPATSA
jgi:acyl-coenzyme A thioesterase PaaI-like protein